uniref:Bobbit n=1 Tax=Silene vulgaris TaxID=42043 RepID=H8XXM0_SILVU|nr:bobbit [Silene vulgaris]
MEFSPRAAELTTLLESRISNLNMNFQVDEIGRVVSVGDGIARVYGLNEIQAGEMVEFASGVKGIIDLHHDIFFFLILILVFVSWILVRVIKLKMASSSRGSIRGRERAGGSLGVSGAGAGDGEDPEERKRKLRRANQAFTEASKKEVNRSLVKMIKDLLTNMGPRNRMNGQMPNTVHLGRLVTDNIESTVLRSGGLESYFSEAGRLLGELATRGEESPFLENIIDEILDERSGRR